MEISYIMGKDVSYEQLYAVQERLLKAGIAIVMCGLNAKVGSDITLLGHVMERCRTCDRNNGWYATFTASLR